MDINATLIGQSIAFLVFVLFCYKFIWPPISGAIEKRQKEIADSLNSAAKMREEIVSEKNQADLEISKAKLKAKEILSEAEKQASQIVEQAHEQATAKAEQIIEQANKNLALEASRVRKELRAEVGAIAVQIAEKIVERELSAKDNQDIIDNALSKL
ncbi:F0F1 ATP synthase subunit B [Psittacicella hinzii]|uniref:ATP synthase subunit b n=1 Tax=Psittacicella hinzii TaxID=2028575 RepID=A0A3A1YT60_9GAMM|nr:F0F1 ATP synthase subunit B [Psittacicella hinzii]RIY39584.1 F0F1 ATP synthase subunit B [Psittacicella hinzii]